MPRSTLMLSLALLLAVLPLSAAPPPGSASAKGLLLVANANEKVGRDGEGYVSIFDPASGEKIATVQEGAITAHELIVSPDGRMAFAPIYGNGAAGRPGGTDGTNIVVIDIAAHRVVGNIDFGHGTRPHQGVFGPQDGLLYVTTEVDKTVSIIDPHTLKIVGSIPTGVTGSHFFAISHDGRRGYVSSFDSGMVSVLDLQARKLITLIPVSADRAPGSPERPTWRAQRISISPDDSMVFTSDWTKPQLAVIDTATNKVKAWVPQPAFGYGSASTPDGHYLLVAAEGASKVSVIDLHTLQVARNIDVPATPQEILIRPDGQYAYVSCEQSQKVVVIRLSDWTVEKLISTGRYPDGLAWVKSN